jgi:hypothetical protein
MLLHCTSCFHILSCLISCERQGDGLCLDHGDYTLWRPYQPMVDGCNLALVLFCTCHMMLTWDIFGYFRKLQ